MACLYYLMYSQTKDKGLSDVSYKFPFDKCKRTYNCKPEFSDSPEYQLLQQQGPPVCMQLYFHGEFTSFRRPSIQKHIHDLQFLEAKLRRSSFFNLLLTSTGTPLYHNTIRQLQPISFQFCETENKARFPFCYNLLDNCPPFTLWRTLKPSLFHIDCKPIGRIRLSQ